MKYKNVLVSLAFGFLVCNSLIIFLHSYAFASTDNLDKIFSISGTIDFSHDSGKLSPIFSYNSLSWNDSKPGNYSVEFLDQNNFVLFKQSFEPWRAMAGEMNVQRTFFSKLIDYLCRIPVLNKFIKACNVEVNTTSNPGGFGFRLPFKEGVKAVRLMHGSKVLDQLKPGPNYPTVKINPVQSRNLPEAGEFKFSWIAREPDGDKLNYEVYYSTDNQKTWTLVGTSLSPEISWDVSRLPKSSSVYFQVLVSDGINTASDIIGPFSSSLKMPAAEITNPKDGDSIQQGYPIILLGSGSSPEEENTIPDERLTWSSDISGILGNGQTLQVEKPLAKGRHVVTLTVLDKYGNKSSASINLTIK